MKLKLKEKRLERGWTQEHLAGLLGCSKSHISEMESGKKNASGPMLDQIAKLFGVNVLEMIDAGDLSDVLSQFVEIMAATPPEDRQNALRAASAWVAPSK